MKLIKILTLSVATLGVSLSLNSCQDDPLDQNTNLMPIPDTTADSGNSNDNNYISHLPIYISSQTFAADADKRADLCQSFPQSASPTGATMCIFDASEVISQSSAIKTAFERGAVVSIVQPTQESIAKLKLINNQISVLDMFNLDGVEIVAFDKDKHNYELINNSRSNLNESVHPEENLLSEDDSAVRNNEHSNQFNEFARWLDSIQLEKFKVRRSQNSVSGKDFENYTPAVSANGQNVYLDYKVDIPSTEIHQVACSDADYLDAKTTHIIVDLQITPFHVFQTAIEGATDYSGDYYIIEGSIVARNGECYEIYRHKHGLIQVKARGWFMTGMNVGFSLLDEEGKSVTPNFYQEQPYPGTSIGSTTYTHTSSHGFNFSLGAMYMGAPVPMGSVGYSYGWSNTTSFTLPDVQILLNTPDNKVQYKYQVNNITFDKSNDIDDKCLPLVSHSDLSSKFVWIWWVPAKKYASVEDTKTSIFKLRCDVTGDYEVQHYQSAHSFPGTKEYNYRNSRTVELQRPERRQFSILQVMNTRKDEAIGHVKVWQQDDAGNKIGDAILESSNAACQKDLIKEKVFVGKYIVEYESFKNNERTGIWQHKNVELKLGPNEQNSYTQINSFDGTLIGK